MPACVSVMSFILEKQNIHSLFFFFFQETLICPSADLIRGWKYLNYCFPVVFYFLTGPHPDKITYLHAGNVRKELEKSFFFFFWSLNLCDNLFAKQNQKPVILPAPPSRTLLHPGSSPTPLYVKERWILLLFNSFWVCCEVLDFMEDTAWMWNPLI